MHTRWPDAKWLVVGVNHQRAGIAQREVFALSAEQQAALLADTRALGLSGGLVLATCNRTELYARTDCPQPIVDLLVRHTGSDADSFHRLGFVLHAELALLHLLRVTTGLDSLVLGDVQIPQQVKQAYKLAQAHGLADSFVHKALQFVMKAHKRARHETAIGSGAASVAHAAVGYIRSTGARLPELRVLVIGAGKIGKVTLKNLVSLGAAEVCLINRAPERAERLAEGLAVRTAPWEALADEVALSDVVICATGAPEPVVLPAHVRGTRPRLFIDLALPRNIDPAIASLPHQRVVNMDDLAQVVDEAADRRNAARPAVEAIIDQELDAFGQWLHQQRLTPTVKALVAHFEAIKAQELAHARADLSPEARAELERITHRLVNKLLAQPFQALRSANGQTEALIEAVGRLYNLTPETD